MLYMRYEDYVRFVDFTFNLLNGRINTKIIADSYVLGEKTKPNNFGSAMGNRLKINLDNILSYSDLMNNNDPYRIKGLILGAIAHELSHLDQDIDYSRMSNKEYKEFIERTNDANALMYIEQHYDELQYYLNLFDMELIMGIHYTEPATYFPYYKRIEQASDKIFMIMKSMFRSDIRSIMKERDLKNILLTLKDLYNDPCMLFLLNKGTWIPTKESMDFLTYIMTQFKNINVNILAANDTKTCRIDVSQLPDDTFDKKEND